MALNKIVEMGLRKIISKFKAGQATPEDMATLLQPQVGDDVVISENLFGGGQRGTVIETYDGGLKIAPQSSPDNILNIPQEGAMKVTGDPEVNMVIEEMSMSPMMRGEGMPLPAVGTSRPPVDFSLKDLSAFKTKRNDAIELAEAEGRTADAGMLSEMSSDDFLEELIFSEDADLTEAMSKEIRDRFPGATEDDVYTVLAPLIETPM